jgi:hypothetical protein
MRPALERLAVVLAALGGCTANGAERGSGAGFDGDDAAEPPAEARCDDDSDCEPAASSCCECPSFALSVGEGFGAACESVDCDGAPTSECSELAEPVCVEARCELRCREIALQPDQFCDGGYVRDELGCLTTQCLLPDPTAIADCSGHTDCEQVPADCCGCELGGRDTAVNSANVDAHLESLGCSAQPACPGVNVCDENVIPQCLASRCQLVSMPDGGVGEAAEFCGTTALAPCPAGRVCVLNAADANDAARFGVGVCRPE